MWRNVLLLSLCGASLGCRDWSFVDEGDGGPIMTDGGTDCVGCDCLMTDTVVCEDFEGPLDTWTIEGGASAEWVTTDSVSGTGSVRVRIGPSETAFRRQTFPAVSSGELWMRAHVRVPAGAAIDGVGLMSMGRGGDQVELDLVANGGADQYGAAMTYGPLDSVFAGGPSIRDSWECLEVRVAIGAPGRLELRREGALIDSRDPSSTTIAGGFEELEYGVFFSRPTQGSLELLLDDVILSRTRIPCP